MSFGDDDEDNGEVNLGEKRIAMIEFLILKRLNSVYIARLYECIADSKLNKVVFVMEFCDLGTLMDLNENNTAYVYNDKLLYLMPGANQGKENDKWKFSFISNCAKILFKQLALALKYIHNKKIVHRDIKPDNILAKTGENNEVLLKMIDFSISKIMKSTDSKINSQQGTPEFMPQEILEEEKHNPFKVDIYLFGATLYVFLFNNFDFQNFNTDEELYNNIFEIDNNLALLLKRTLGHWEDRPRIEDIVKDVWFN